MSRPAVTLDLQVDLYEEGVVPVLRVAGIPGHAEAWFLIDNGTVRTLGPMRGLPARLPERPFAPGLPSLASILRDAVEVTQ